MYYYFINHLLYHFSAKVIEMMSLAVKIKESETLKTQIKSKRVNFKLSPTNNEELTIVSTFLSTYDVVTDTITITLPVNTQDSVLLTLTENIGKSTHEVKDNTK